jgi:hypothetical protein
MATVLQRTTLELREDVAAASFDPTVWLVDPDLSGVAGVPVIYWKVVGDTVVEKTAAEKVAADAAYLAEQKGVVRATIGMQANVYIGARYDEATQRTFLALQIDARGAAVPLVNRAIYIQQGFDWCTSVLAYYVQKVLAIYGAPDLAALQAITWSFSGFDATDPLITVPGALSILN